MHSTRALWIVILSLVVLPHAIGLCQAPPAETALDQYIQKEDPSYQWKIVSDEQRDGMQIVVVDMISQTWRSTEEVDRPVWQRRVWQSLAWGSFGRSNPIRHPKVAMPTAELPSSFQRVICPATPIRAISMRLRLPASRRPVRSTARRQSTTY